MVDDEKGKYILTKMNKKELKDLYKSFGEMFNQIKEMFIKIHSDGRNTEGGNTESVSEELQKKYNELVDKFITEFFKSQCLTRSTCLIGTLMLIILKGHLIKLTGLIDYEAILTGKITKYELLKSLDDYVNECYDSLTLSDVLMCFKILKNNSN